eukprot:tig00000455_g988.t1
MPSAARAPRRLRPRPGGACLSRAAGLGAGGRAGAAAPNPFLSGGLSGMLSYRPPPAVAAAAASAAASAAAAASAPPRPARAAGPPALPSIRASHSARGARSPPAATGDGDGGGGEAMAPPRGASASAHSSPRHSPIPGAGAGAGPSAGALQGSITPPASAEGRRPPPPFPFARQPAADPKK